MRGRVITLFTNVLLLLSACYGQVDSNERFGLKSYLANNLNPFFTLGLGGGNPLGFSPSLGIKVNNAHLKFSSDLEVYKPIFSAQVELDMFRLKKWSKRNPTFITAATGYSERRSRTDRDASIISINGLLGINRYLTNTNFRLSAKIGAQMAQARYGTDWNNYQYLTPGFYPYGELSLSVYLLKFRNPYRTPKEERPSLYNPKLYSALCLFTKSFNASVGVGLGGSHAEHWSPTLGFNFGPITVRMSSSSTFYPSRTSSTDVVQWGIEFMPMDLVKGYKSKVALSYEYTDAYKDCTYDGYYCSDYYTTNAVLVGLNSYGINRNISFSTKVGVGYRRGNNSTNTFKSKNATYPYGELSVNYHAFKFREGQFWNMSKLLTAWDISKDTLGSVDRFLENRNSVKEYRLAKKQGDTILRQTSKVDWNRFFGNNLNPGISIGIGDGRTNGYMPSLALKIWRFNVKGMQYEYNLIMNKAFQIEADLLWLNRNELDKPIYLTGGFGVTERYPRYNRPEQFPYKGRGSILFGMNQYGIQKRLKLSAKLGISAFTQSTKSVYYGELSANYYLVPFSARRPLKPINLGQGFRERQKMKEDVPAFYPKLSKYFNPRISLGIGSTHPSFIFPTLGGKIGRFDGGVGVGMDTYHDVTISANVDFDVWEMRRDSTKFLTAGASVSLFLWDVFASANVGVKKYYYKSAFSWKVGVGFYESFPLPTVDLSYHLYLFRFGK